MKIGASHRALIIMALLAAGANAPSVSAATFYVDQAKSTASDNNPGTEALPWKTLYRIESQALQPGDTVYVKAGTYDASIGGNWAEPSITPSTSGTADNPITIRSLPRHAAIVQGGASAPGIGVSGRNYIVIDGFVILARSTHGLNVFGNSSSSRAKGNVIQNNIIHGVYNSHPSDNTDGIRIENASGTVIRNNTIYDVHNGTDFWNAAGIKLYTTDGTVVENNEIYDTPSGIFDKDSGTNNVYRRNFVHDTSVVGIMFSTQNGILSTGHQVYENIFNRCNRNVIINPADARSVVDKVWVYNNVFANYAGEGGVNPSQYAGKLYLYNNIFYRANAPQWGDFFTYNDPPATIGSLDYNLYPSSPKMVIGRYVTNRTYTSLPSWQSATGFDAHSFTGDPGFVNAASGDFHLAPGSLAQNAGRSGGVSGGVMVNMGAYPKGDEVIGLLKDTTVPAAPVLLNVQ